MRTSKYTGGLLLLMVLAWLCIGAKNIFDAGSKAFVYGYPIVLMDETKQQMLIKEPRMVNQFVHRAQFPNHRFRDVVRPNVDTLYSVAWLDLSYEPLVLTVPDTQGRYYVMPFMDAWTNVFASVGKRETGTLAGEYLIRGPEFYQLEKSNSEQATQLSDLPIISSPTNMVWLIGRIQTNGADDIALVVSLQKKFSLTPLSQWLEGGHVYRHSKPEFTKTRQEESNGPFQRVMSMSSIEFLSRLAVLVQTQGASENDELALTNLHMIGVDVSRYDASYKPSIFYKWLIEKSFSLTKKKITQRLKSRKGQENGWAVMRQNIGSYGTNYIARMGVAMIGLGALAPAEAVYPNTSVDSMGKKLHGDYNYKLHFDAQGLPPVAAFWSLTVYDKDGFLVESEIDRYALGDRDQLEFNTDGSLDILIQHSPPIEKLSNWLPVPDSPFTLTLRMYQPKEEFLNGQWRIPGVEKIN
jgi:hypothetical protein